MKKKLIFLFAVIIAACSDSDMSGYTDSIIKGTSSTNLENTFLQKTSDTKESNSSLEEELLGLDDEELREKLIKTYPWPNVQRVQGVNNTSEAGSSSSSENPGSSSSEIHYSEALPIPLNPHSGKIEPFDIKSFITKEHVVYITKGKDHLYGFDGLDKECLLSKNIPNHCRLKIAGETSKDDNPVIYISVKQWETAYFTPHKFKNQKEARIIHEKKYVEEDGELKLVEVHPGKNLSKVAEETNDKDKQLVDEEQYPIDVKSYGDAGLYGIYVPKDAKAAINEKQLNAKNDDSRWKRILFIQVIPYEEITKHITLVAFNGDKGDKLDPDSDTCDDGFSDDGITKACLTKNFNEVYSQAVMNVDVTQEPAKDYGITDMIEVWMNDTYQTSTKGYQIMHNIAKNKVKNKIKKYTLKDPDPDPHWHIVFAINKVRKIWELDKCIKQTPNDLNLCTYTRNISPTKEKNKNGNAIKYFLGKKKGKSGDNNRLETDKNGKIKGTEVEIRLTQEKINNQYYYHMYLFKKGQNNPYNFQDKDVLFTEEGFPIVPAINTVRDNLVAFHEGFDKSFDIDKHDDYLSYGGIAYVPGIAGKKSTYYTLLHELGHSFGLTDVSSTNIYQKTETDESSENKYHSIEKQGDKYIDNVGKAKFTNYYATSETNLMTWQVPMGAKLQYRETQIVCTGGSTYYKKLNNNGEFDKNAGKHGQLEKKIQNAFEPNQWECIRENCHDPKYSKKYSTQERKNYFKEKNENGPCKENTKPEEEGKNLYISKKKDYNLKKLEYEKNRLLN